MQEVYRDKYYQQVVEFEAAIESVPSIKQVQTQTGFIPETAKTIALARVDLVLEWQKFRCKHKPRNKGDKLFLDLYNSGEYLRNVFGIIGKTSRGSLQRWYKLYSEYESWEVLVPQYNYTSFQEYRTILSEEEIGIFLKLLLHPNQFSIGKAIKLTTHILEKRGVENIPKPVTFRRYAEYFKKTNYDKWVLMREGEKKLRDSVMPYIKRDISKLEVGQCLVTDGHKLSCYSLIVQMAWGKSAKVLQCA